MDYHFVSFAFEVFQITHEIIYSTTHKPFVYLVCCAICTTNIHNIHFKGLACDWLETASSVLSFWLVVGVRELIYVAKIDL